MSVNGYTWNTDGWRWGSRRVGRDEQWRLVTTENVRENARDSKGGRSQRIAKGVTLNETEGRGGKSFSGKWKVLWHKLLWHKLLWHKLQHHLGVDVSVAALVHSRH